MNKKQRMWIYGGVSILLGIILVMGWTLWKQPSSGTTAMATNPERQVLYWHDPMYPGTRFNKPGKSPFMDMELVPVYADGEGTTGGAAVVTVRPEVINNLGVRTYTVKRAALAHQVNAQGYLVRTSNGGLMAQVDVFDRETDWIQAGLPVELRVSDLPGQLFHARVESVDTDVDHGSRVQKVRIVLRQKNADLLPNMSVEATLRTPGTTVLAVPREALIRTANRTAVVRALGGGRFQPVDVVLGPERGEWIEIRKGIKDGDVVVVSGQFLLDSESSLRATFQRMESPGEAADSPKQKSEPGAKP